MLNNISWASYVIAISIIVIIYYSFLLVIYCRNDLFIFLKKLTPGRLFKAFSGKSQLKPEDDDTGFERPMGELNSSNAVAEHLLQIEGIIKNGTYCKSPKDEIFTALKIYLQKERMCLEEADHEVITQSIIVQFKKNCSIHLTEEEVGVLWIN